MSQGRDQPDTTSTLHSADWSREDLGAVVHESVLFQSPDLSEAVARGARFVDCVFRSADLSFAAFTACSFENCLFVRCTLLAATFTECKLLGGRFRDCDFDRVRVDGGDWSFVSLAGADLHLARFDGVRMREADLTAARCQGATLTSCDLARAQWSRADLTGADLRGSDLSALDPTSVTLARAIVNWDQAVVVAAGFGLDVRPD